MGVGSLTGQTVYDYGNGGTQAGGGGTATTQTGKRVYNGDASTGSLISETRNTYNVQGRLQTVEIDSDGGATFSPDKTVNYEYDDNGFRVAKEENGTVTRYLADANNHSGYTQVLEELDNTGTVQESFMLGHDVLAELDSTNGLVYLLADGHGSTRQLLDDSGTVVTANSIPQVFSYTAYGEALGFDESDAITAMLYSGEWFEITTGQQYLRARYYDPSSGRFNRLDPFVGNLSNPLGLHKYLYANSNPVMLLDPTGEFAMVATLGSLSVRGALRGAQFGAVGAATGAVFGAIDAGLAGEDMLNGALRGAKWGGAIGFGAGFLAPFATTFLSGPAQSFLLNLGAGASLTFGAVGATDSFANGNTVQGIFRLGTSFLGAYGLRRAAIRPTKPVNIGGEGEVPNVINLQPRSALTSGFGRSRPVASGPQGRSLAGMILEGHDFQIYNAGAGRLPYATASVPKVYTNNVPVDRPFGANPEL